MKNCPQFWDKSPVTVQEFPTQPETGFDAGLVVCSLKYRHATYTTRRPGHY